MRTPRPFIAVLACAALASACSKESLPDGTHDDAATSEADSDHADAAVPVGAGGAGVEPDAHDSDSTPGPSRPQEDAQPDATQSTDAQPDPDAGQVAEPSATCDDGIRNGGETGTDCGGPCSPCEIPCGLQLIVDGNVGNGCGGEFGTCLNLFNGFRNCLCNNFQMSYEECCDRIAGGFSAYGCGEDGRTQADFIEEMSDWVHNTVYGNMTLSPDESCTEVPVPCPSGSSCDADCSF